MSNNSAIRSELNEYKAISEKIDSLNAELRQLRKRKTELEEKIINIMGRTGEKAVMYNNKAFILDTKKKTNRKKNSDKRNDLINILSRQGVAQPERVAEDILRSQKGETQEVPRLKVA